MAEEGLIPLILSMSKEMSGTTIPKVYPLKWFDRLTMSGTVGINYPGSSAITCPVCEVSYPPRAVTCSWNSDPRMISSNGASSSLS